MKTQVCVFPRFSIIYRPFPGFFSFFGKSKCVCMSLWQTMSTRQTFRKMHSWQWKFNILYLGHERNSEQLASYQLTGPGQLQFISAVNRSDIVFSLQCNRSPQLYMCVIAELFASYSSSTRTAVVLLIKGQKNTAFFGLLMCIVVMELL